jgi:hypothetical protein
MHSNDGEWNRATTIALDAYEAALRNDAENEWAVVIALTAMRTIVSTATESDVRQALSIMLAERRLAARSLA